MKRTKTLNLIALFVNLLLVGSTVAGFVLGTLVGNPPINFPYDLRYFAYIVSLVVGVLALFNIINNIINITSGYDHTPRLLFTLRYGFAVLSVVCLICVAAVPVSEFGGINALFDFKTGSIFFTFIIPVLSFVEFCFLEVEPKAKFKKTFGPLIYMFIYTLAILIAILILNLAGRGKEIPAFAPYSFFNFFEGDKLTKIITIVILLVGTYVLAIVVWGVNRIFSAIIIGQKVEIEEKPEVVEVSDGPQPSKSFSQFIAQKISYIPTEPANPAELNHVYHISYADRKAKTWKVKSEGAQRALKIFNTQKEAIEFAKNEVKLHGGSIRIHSMLGKIRSE